VVDVLVLGLLHHHGAAQQYRERQGLLEQLALVMLA